MLGPSPYEVKNESTPPPPPLGVKTVIQRENGGRRKKAMQEGETRRLFSRFLDEKTPFAIKDNPYNLARILNSSRSSKHAKPLGSGQKPFNGVLRKVSQSQNDKTLYCFSLILKNRVTIAPLTRLTMSILRNLTHPYLELCRIETLMFWLEEISIAAT